MKYKKINFEERRAKKIGQVDQDKYYPTRIKIHLAVEYE